MHEKLLIVNFLYFLFPRLTQEYLDLSFGLKYESTTLNSVQVNGIIVYQNANFKYWIFQCIRLLCSCRTPFLITAHMHVPHHHAHKAWLCNNNIMVVDIAVDLDIMGRGPGLAIGLSTSSIFLLQDADIWTGVLILTGYASWWMPVKYLQVQPRL